MAKKQVTNEELLELLQESLQMTSDGFIRLEKEMDEMKGDIREMKSEMGEMKGEMGEMKSQQHNLEKQYGELREIVDKIASEQQAQGNDIGEILDRLLAIEKRLPNITEAEVREMQTGLQAVTDWARKIAKANKIALKLPKS